MTTLEGHIMVSNTSETVSTLKSSSFGYQLKILDHIDDKLCFELLGARKPAVPLKVEVKYTYAAGQACWLSWLHSDCPFE